MLANFRFPKFIEKNPWICFPSHFAMCMLDQNRLNCLLYCSVRYCPCICVWMGMVFLLFESFHHEVGFISAQFENSHCTACINIHCTSVCVVVKQRKKNWRYCKNLARSWLSCGKMSKLCALYFAYRTLALTLNIYSPLWIGKLTKTEVIAHLSYRSKQNFGTSFSSFQWFYLKIKIGKHFISKTIRIFSYELQSIHHHFCSELTNFRKI